MISTRVKAGRLLLRLYLMRKCDFKNIEVEQILAKATTFEINFYYYWICKGGDKHHE